MGLGAFSITGACSMNGIADGYEDKMRPQDSATLAETSKMIRAFMEIM